MCSVCEGYGSQKCTRVPHDVFPGISVHKHINIGFIYSNLLESRPCTAAHPKVQAIDFTDLGPAASFQNPRMLWHRALLSLQHPDLSQVSSGQIKRQRHSRQWCACEASSSKTFYGCLLLHKRLLSCFLHRKPRTNYTDHSGLYSVGSRLHCLTWAWSKWSLGWLGSFASCL